jgi:hypothetical protein
MPKTRGDTVTLTPAVNTTLTFGSTTKGLTQGAVGNNIHGIAIGGNAVLVAGATYTVASEAGKVGTLTASNTLTIGGGDLVPPAGFANTATDSASLVLTGATSTNGAKLDGLGKIVAGKTEIVGGEVGTASWQAFGAGNVTITADKITVSAETVALTAVDGAAKPSITVAAGGNLTLAANTAIALKGDGSAVGSIVLEKGSAPAKITFAAAGAKITTALTSGNTAVTAPIAGSITANGGSVGSGLEVQSTAANGNDLKLGAIVVPSADPTFDGTVNVISGPTTGTADTTINSTTTVTAGA